MKFLKMKTPIIAKAINKAIKSVIRKRALFPYMNLYLKKKNLNL